ncbi:GntR family transcriptional regulator [Candidatus Formimonas warabiya]|uniref:GntR family transcriptional regulator n=1 Tax=Formimonas warabiya TaxID=1761012 RepID=UPI001BE423AF|nr:GntR family transcriptional regulator [Candidatus Formimonas warabiya]
MDEKSLKIEKIPITRTEVFEKMYTAIISGYFKPGDRLVERDLSHILGVSRTPIREVLRELERLNLVKSEPYKGVFVNIVTIKEANDIFVVRKNMEGLATRLCVENITEEILENLDKNLLSYREALKTNDVQRMLELDDDFHSIIYNATNNNILISMIHNLRTMISYFRVYSLPTRQKETYQEHEDVFRAIKSKDADLAEKAIQDHIAAFWVEVKHHINKANQANFNDHPSMCSK